MDNKDCIVTRDIKEAARIHSDPKYVNWKYEYVNGEYRFYSLDYIRNNKKVCNSNLTSSNFLYTNISNDYSNILTEDINRQKKSNRSVIRRILKVCVIVLTFFFFTFYNTRSYSGSDDKNISVFENIEDSDEISKSILEGWYSECMSEGLADEEFNEITKNKKEKLLNYIKDNDIKYYYFDLTNNYEIKNNENDSVYGASLIKLVVALYLIDNDIDLSQTIKYESRYVKSFSKGMKKHKIGADVTLGELMKYSIKYSDNSAHIMLIDFIGKQKLKDYGKSLGARVTLEGIDSFGNQTASDMIIYLKRAIKLFYKNESGEMLKQYMFNNDKNALNFDKVKFAHKYGSHSVYFHDVGIYMGDYPYLIAVLTTKGEVSGPSYVTEVSRLTYDFHKEYYNNLSTYCMNK